jgi:hypothetical protein
MKLHQSCKSLPKELTGVPRTAQPKTRSKGKGQLGTFHEDSQALALALNCLPAAWSRSWREEDWPGPVIPHSALLLVLFCLFSGGRHSQS